MKWVGCINVAGCTVARQDLQGETFGDDLGLLHQAQGFAGQPSQSFPAVD